MHLRRSHIVSVARACAALLALAGCSSSSSGGSSGAESSSSGGSGSAPGNGASSSSGASGGGGSSSSGSSGSSGSGNTDAGQVADTSTGCTITAASAFTFDINQMDPGSDPSCQAFVEIDTAKASSQGCDCTTTTKAACEVAISCSCTDKQRISTAKYSLDLLVQGTTISGGGTVVNGAGTTCAYSNVTGNVD